MHPCSFSYLQAFQIVKLGKTIQFEMHLFQKMENFDEIEIEILKSKIEGLETEVLSLRNKLRTQADYFAKSVKLLSQMDFLLQLRYPVVAPNHGIELDNCQPTTDVIIEESKGSTDEITDQQIDDAIDKEIYEESDEDSSYIEEVPLSEESELLQPNKSEENIEVLEVVTINVQEPMSKSLSQITPRKSNKRKRNSNSEISYKSKKKKTNRASAVYSRVDGLYRCPFTDICSYTTKYSSNLPKHIRIHTGERKYSCDYCDKTFTDANSCLSHKLRHPESGAQKCTKCKRLIQPTKLEDHMINCKSSIAKKKAGRTNILLQLK